MRVPLIVWVVCALLLSPIAAANSPEPENSPGASHRILVMGDSLSAAYGMAQSDGWVDLLRARLAQRASPWTVENASISGETTAGGRQRLPGLLERHVPDIVILGLGGNDGLRGLAPSAMRDNLAKMLDAIDQADAQALLLGVRIPPNYGPVYTRRFEAVFAELAEARSIAFEPFLLEGVALEEGMMQSDGIHPSPAAQPQLLETVWSRLESMLEAVEDDHQAGPLRDVQGAPARIQSDLFGVDSSAARAQASRISCRTSRNSFSTGSGSRPRSTG